MAFYLITRKSFVCVNLNLSFLWVTNSTLVTQNFYIMTKSCVYLAILFFSSVFINAQNTSSIKPNSSPPRLPMNIPPPPSFASLSSKSGKYQLMSAEYYSQDSKPYLYKRLVKFDTTTGEAWILHSKIGANGETRTWIPLENKSVK